MIHAPKPVFIMNLSSPRTPSNNENNSLVVFVRHEVAKQSHKKDGIATLASLIRSDMVYFLSNSSGYLTSSTLVNITLPPINEICFMFS